MFTSINKLDTNNSYGIEIDPFSYYTDQPNRQFPNDIINTSTSTTTFNPREDDLISPFSSFYYLPSPLFPPYNGVLMELEEQGLLLQEEEHESIGVLFHGEPVTTTSACCDDSISAETILNMVDSSRKLEHHHHQAAEVYRELVRANEEEEAQVIRRSRSSKRDRHSKINTAQGPRDRRMRLSLKVAREFFDVQDVLGFDKASKTVEWLLIQSKSSIEKLYAGVPGQMTMNYSCKSASSPSECEVISGLDEAGTITGISPKGTSKTSPSGSKKARRTRSSSTGRKPAALQPLARESRAKARARARERTMEKKRVLRLDTSSKLISQEATNLNQLGSCWGNNAYGTGREDQYSSSSSSGKQSFNHNMNPPPPPPPSFDAFGEANARIHQKQERFEAATGCFIDDSLVIMSKWSPSSILMSHLQGNSNIPQELHHQFPDFQSMCKNW